ncbi:MAG TPA: class I SAM-dependent methyltransferase [Stellaceae bacterium]|nr:class I SAM-dependent methyltransferase [Stellaceae bacterium]
MTASGATFSREWLALREPLDAQARDAELTRRFVAALPAHPRLLDLAAGSGANFRYLAPRFGGAQDWLLVDKDAALLAAARSDAPSCCVSCRALDLARDLGRLDFGAFDGIAANALLDLVSAAWLDDFAGRIAAARRPLLVTLSVDGRAEWRPAAPEDALIAAAFACHQARDKGFGPALGAAAAGHLAQRLTAAGYEVAMRRSDWRLGPGAALEAVIEGMAGAAREAMPDRAAAIAAWAERRRAQAREGALSLRLGHVDLFGAPR